MHTRSHSKSQQKLRTDWGLLRNRSWWQNIEQKNFCYTRNILTRFIHRSYVWGSGKCWGFESRNSRNLRKFM